MGTAAISFGPKLGLLNNAAIGEQYYDQLRPFLRGMDALIMGSVIAASVTAPPASPNDGDAYLLLAGAIGDWAGHQGDIAVYSSQITEAGGNTLAPGWDFYTPKTGWLIWDTEAGGFIYFDGTNWAQFSNGYVLQNPTSSQYITQPVGTQLTVVGTSPSGQPGSVTVYQDGVNITGRLTVPAQDEAITAANYTIDPNFSGSDAAAPAWFYTVDASLNNVAIQLPIANGQGNTYCITRNDRVANANTVTITAASGNLIGGKPSITLTNYSTLTVVVGGYHTDGSPNGWSIQSLYVAS